MSTTLKLAPLTRWASGFQTTTPINEGKGKILLTNSIIKSDLSLKLKLKSIYFFHRREILLKKPNIPVESGMKSLPDSENNTYMDLTNSDIDSDAAQSVVPFFDTQTVTCEPYSPLAGAGMFHKGLPLSGGFIAPKIYTYDFSPHIQLVESNEAAFK